MAAVACERPQAHQPLRGFGAALALALGAAFGFGALGHKLLTRFLLPCSWGLVVAVLTMLFARRPADRRAHWQCSQQKVKVAAPV